MVGDEILTDVEQRVVDLRVDGKSFSEIGRALGFSRQAAQQHAAKPHVKAAIRGEHADIIAAARQRVSMGYKLGLDGLIALAKDPSHKDHFNACRKLIEMVDPAAYEVIATKEDLRAKAMQLIANMTDEDLGLED